MVKELDDDKKKKNHKIAKNLYIFTLTCIGIISIAIIIRTIILYNTNQINLINFIKYLSIGLVIVLFTILTTIYFYKLSLNNNTISDLMVWTVIVFVATLPVFYIIGFYIAKKFFGYNPKPDLPSNE